MSNKEAWGAFLKSLISYIAGIAALLSASTSVAFAQSGPEQAVLDAAGKAGFTRCDPPVDQYIRRPDEDPNNAPKTSRIQRCWRGKLGDIWRITPTPAGPGINAERTVLVDYRADYGTHLMWVAPNKAYIPHDLYFVGRTTKSGPSFEPLKGFEDWNPLGVTLPFIPGEVVYFGSAAGVSRIGFTDLMPLPGLESKMYPLTRDSVVMALSGAGFTTSQNYVRFFGNKKGAGFKDWRTIPFHIEVQYYQSRATTESVATMRADARVAYLPVYPISDVRKAWDAATNRPGARSLTLGVTGDIVKRMLGPLATFNAALDAVGWDEEEYQRRSKACRDAGGIC